MATACWNVPIVIFRSMCGMTTMITSWRRLGSLFWGSSTIPRFISPEPVGLSHAQIGGELYGGEFMFFHHNLVGMDDRILRLSSLGNEIFSRRYNDAKLALAVAAGRRYNLLIRAKLHRQRTLVRARPA